MVWIMRLAPGKRGYKKGTFYLSFLGRPLVKGKIPGQGFRLILLARRGAEWGAPVQAVDQSEMLADDVGKEAVSPRSPAFYR